MSNAPDYLDTTTIHCSSGDGSSLEFQAWSDGSVTVNTKINGDEAFSVIIENRQELLQWLQSLDDEEPQSLPDFIFMDQGSIWLCQAQHPGAHGWLQEAVGDDAMWHGESLVVEPRYVENLAAGMDEEGYAVQMP